MNRRERRRRGLRSPQAAGVLTREDPAALLDRGVEHHRGGRLDDAIACYRRALDAQPGHFAAHANLGVALREKGELEAAEASLRRALAIRPAVPQVLDTLGDVLLGLDRREEAVACFQEALALSPDMVNARSHLGIALLDAGCPEEAARQFRRAIQLDPADPHSHNNLGVALLRTGQRSEAAACFSRALELAPRFWGACIEMGWLLHEENRLDDSMAFFQQALEERPDEFRSRWGTGLVLLKQSRAAEALQLWEPLLGQQPSPALRIQAATALPLIPASSEDVSAWRERFVREVEALAEEPPEVADPLAEVLSIHFPLAYHGRDDRPLAEALARLHLRMCPSLSWTAPHCLEDGGSDVPERLRVGFISANLTGHTIQMLSEGLLRELDRSRFDVVLLPIASPGRTLPGGDEGTRVVPLEGGLPAMRERVADERLDVLFYLDIGMEPASYFMAFARLAPVQVVTWGHPVTTGLPTVDYFLSSELLEPEGAEAHYTESLVRLRSLPACYARPREYAADRAAFGFADDDHLYVCPQTLFKLHPDGDALMAEILRRDPRGRLVLLEGLSRHWDDALRERLARAHADVADRVVFIPRMTRARFLTLLATADVLLDPPGFGGGNTTYEGLACGTPIVTWPGPFMRGRVTHACYRKMGWLGCVADSPQAYVDLAVRLGADPEAREAARREILSRNHVLYEDREAVREIERFMEEAVAERR